MMKVLILGCGRTGSLLSQMLFALGHEVTIIDYNPDAFRRLGDLRVNRVVGSGIDTAALKRAGIESADVFVAVTNGDNTNIMSAQIARTEFGVKRAVARIYDPIRAQAYREMGLSTLCTPLLAAGLLQDYILDKQWGAVTDYVDPIAPDWTESE